MHTATFKVVGEAPSEPGGARHPRATGDPLSSSSSSLSLAEKTGLIGPPQAISLCYFTPPRVATGPRTDGSRMNSSHR
jgi:hypothetical protein